MTIEIHTLIVEHVYKSLMSEILCNWQDSEYMALFELKNEWCL